MVPDFRGRNILQRRDKQSNHIWPVDEKTESRRHKYTRRYQDTEFKIKQSQGTLRPSLNFKCAYYNLDLNYSMCKDHSIEMAQFYCLYIQGQCSFIYTNLNSNCVLKDIYMCVCVCLRQAQNKLDL